MVPKVVGLGFGLWWRSKGSYTEMREFIHANGRWNYILRTYVSFNFFDLPSPSIFSLSSVQCMALSCEGAQRSAYSQNFSFMLVKNVGGKCPACAEQLPRNDVSYISLLLCHEPNVISQWIHDDIFVGLFETTIGKRRQSKRLSSEFLVQMACTSGTYSRMLPNSSCRCITRAEFPRISAAGWLRRRTAFLSSGIFIGVRSVLSSSV